MNDDLKIDVLKVVKFSSIFKNKINKNFEIVHANDLQEVIDMLVLKYHDIVLRDIEAVYNYFPDFKVENNVKSE